MHVSLFGPECIGDNAGCEESPFRLFGLGDCLGLAGNPWALALLGLQVHSGALGFPLPPSGSFHCLFGSIAFS